MAAAVPGPCRRRPPERDGLVPGGSAGVVCRRRVVVDAGSGVLMIGGRSFDPTLQPRLSVDIAGRPVLDETLRPGSFLRLTRLPLDVVTADYPRVTVTTTPGARVAIEQFDASATRTVFGFGEGWHEQEFNPRTG